jgi:hypothetical protein
MKFLPAVIMSALSSTSFSSCHVNAYNLRGTVTATPVPTESMYPSSAPSGYNAPSESSDHSSNPISQSTDNGAKSFVASGGGFGTILPLVSGPNFNPSISKQDIYKGIKTNVGQDESILMPKVFDYSPNNFIYEVNKNSFLHSNIIKDATDIQDALDISGSLSVSYGPCSGSGAGEYLSKNSATKNSVTVLYTQRFSLYSERPNNSYKPVEAIEGLIKSGDYATIANRYGTRFIDQILYGAQLDIKFTVTSNSNVDKDEINAQLKGSIGKGPLSIEFDAKF